MEAQHEMQFVALFPFRDLRRKSAEIRLFSYLQPRGIFRRPISHSRCWRGEHLNLSCGFLRHESVICHLSLVAIGTGMQEDFLEDDWAQLQLMPTSGHTRQE